MLQGAHPEENSWRNSGSCLTKSKWRADRKNRDRSEETGSTSVKAERRMVQTLQERCALCTVSGLREATTCPLPCPPTLQLPLHLHREPPSQQSPARVASLEELQTYPDLTVPKSSVNPLPRRLSLFLLPSLSSSLSTFLPTLLLNADRNQGLGEGLTSKLQILVSSPTSRV